MMGGYPAAAPNSPVVAPMGYPAPYVQAVPAYYDVRQEAAADPASSTPDCGGCGQPACPQCGCPWDCWGHKVGVFGEYLYLRARDADVAYGVPVADPAAAFPVQVGRMGVVDQDYNSGFRFGMSYVLDGWSSVTAQYTFFESDTHDAIAATAPNVVRSMVLHPGTAGATAGWLTGEANYDIGFDFVDVDYRRALSCDDLHNAVFLVGVRGGQFNQDFLATFNLNGTESVATEIDFYGAGVRLGLEGERYSASRRWLVYGKTCANFVAGEFRADYEQWQYPDALTVDTSWKAGRIVSMLDLELGVGWQSRCGTWRITGGYLISAWYNAVTTDEWIKAVQNNDMVGLGDNMTFDGLVLRFEGRF